MSAEAVSLRVNREELLRQLEAVQPGLSPRDIVEQSTCFVFSGGNVATFNDEVACRAETSFGDDLTGAVQAAPLLALLRKMVEEEITITQYEGEMLVEGKRRKSGIRMDAEITLPVDQVETPEEWITLPADFMDAVQIVQECAGKDASQWITTCIHMHPKWIEASDDTQLTRYKVKMGHAEAFLVRRDAIKHIVALDMTEFSETPNWVHFRNATGLVLSCRRFLETYPDTTSILIMEGTGIVLPKGLAEAAEKAQIFSGENADSDQVAVTLKPEKITIKGEGISGWYREVKKIAYDGPEISFRISPKLLIEITKRYNECLVSSTRLMVDGGKWKYMTSLDQSDAAGEPVPTPTPAEDDASEGVF